MLVSINQPAYIPWLGYFQRIAVSDAHIVLDHVQFEKNSFTNRNKVRAKEGWSWLTVPVRTKGRFGELGIDSVELAADSWARKHWDTLRFTYGKAPYFRPHAEFFEAFYARQWTHLAPMLRELTTYLLGAFSITTPVRYSSEMAAEGTKDELVLYLCRKVGATGYLSGALGRAYLREEIFGAAGITVSYQDYAHPTYAQVHGGFEPYMGAVDLLFNHGPESRRILMATLDSPPTVVGTNPSSD